MVLFWLYLTLLFTFFYPQNSYFSETTYCRHLKPFPLDSEWKSWDLRSMWHFRSGWCTPPPQGITKLRSQVNMTFWFWWSARLVNGLEHHPPPLSSRKNEMLGFFGLRSTSDDRPGWSMDSNTICHPSPAKKSEMLIFSTAVCSRQRCLTNHYP